MWFEIFLIFWAIHAKPFRCSLVIDQADQDGIYLKDFCPKMEFCAEGSHTMCLYYNPNRVAGPRCSNFQNISVTPDIAEQLLEMVNEMRGRIAQGIETGHGNVTLPRGYGMFRLKWDNELATFAQVLANTCIIRHDLCRATKRFGAPGQLISSVRFTIPDWLPVRHVEHFSVKGLTEAKIEYAATEAYKSWYNEKQHVTVEMLEKTPDWLSHPSRTQGQLFLQLVDGKATHMGCGVSAYVQYAYYGKYVNDILFNAIHVVCNLSTQPQTGTPVYRMNETTAEELCRGDKRCISRYDSKCGCPPGTAEDDRCLCTDPITYKDPPTCGKDKNCKPAVVLLPIFTVEDAPQHMIARQRILEEMEANSMYDVPSQNPGNSREWEQNEVLSYRRNNKYAYPYDVRQNNKPQPTCSRKQKSSAYIMNSIIPPYTKKRIIDPRHDSEENRITSRPRSLLVKQPIRREYSDRQVKRRNQLPRPSKTSRDSIFSRAPKFELHNSSAKGAVKKDVAPRKDFSKAKKALDKYLNDKKKYHQKPVVKDVPLNDDHNAVSEEFIIESTNTALPTTSAPTTTTEETTTFRSWLNSSTKQSRKRPKHRNNSPENQNISERISKQPKSNQFSKNKHRYFGFNVNKDPMNNIDDSNFVDESDKKLMSILDNLEQEVNHVELDGPEKRILDTKLKKIYGSILKKPKTNVGKSNRHTSNEERYTDFSDDRHFEFEEEKNAYLKEETYPDFKEDRNAYLKEDIHPDFKEDKYASLEEDIYPVSKEKRNSYLKEDRHLHFKENRHHNFDDGMYLDGTDDRDKNEFDRKMYDTEDMVNEIRLKYHDKSSQSLYTRPLTRDQNTLRPITDDKMEYVFRNTFNNVDEFKNRKAKNDYKRTNRYRNSDYNHVKESYESGKDEVKSLPYNLQYKKKDKRDKYRILNKHKENHRIFRADDEKGKNLNRIDEKRVRYEGEIMSEYENDRLRSHNNNKGKHYGGDYEKDYPEDPLSAERRRFYQEKLDHLERKQYLSKGKLGKAHDVERHRPSHGKHILGTRRSRTNASRHYYLPNRASRRGY